MEESHDYANIKGLREVGRVLSSRRQDEITALRHQPGTASVNKIWRSQRESERERQHVLKRVLGWCRAIVYVASMYGDTYMFP